MKELIAFPSEAPGGLDAALSGHFGHCPVFTLVEIEDGRIGDVSVAPNTSHEQGGCLGPVGFLAEKGAKALIAGGMGMRPLMGFHSAGIDVFHNGGLPSVKQALAAYQQGLLGKFAQNHICGHSHEGGCGGH